MKKLPILRKLPDAISYSVSVDNLIDNKLKKEVFHVCIMAHTNEVSSLIQSFSIVNDFIDKEHSPFERYMRELASAYNCKIIYETD